MKVVVTGGAGFIGSNFVRWLLGAEGRQQEEVSRVIVLDSLTYAGNLQNLEEVSRSDRYRFVRGDICDSDLVHGLFVEERPDLVINFAAESHVDRSIVSPREFVRTNVEGTQILLHAARVEGVKRFVQVSTDEVYGALGATGRFLETTPLHPTSPYSASKASADLLAFASHKTYGQDVVITRCTNNYGPYQFPEKLIPLMITNAMQDMKLPVYGGGRNVRSWIHVDDHAAGIWMVAKAGRPGEVYNIGGGEEAERENIDVVKTILRLVGKPESLITYVEDRKGHDWRYAVDASKIRSELGWSPKIAFEPGVMATVEWYKNNEAWWKAVKDGSYREFYDRYYGERLARAV